jgi:hypothetical protein
MKITVTHCILSYLLLVSLFIIAASMYYNRLDICRNELRESFVLGPTDVYYAPGYTFYPNRDIFGWDYHCINRNHWYVFPYTRYTSPGSEAEYEALIRMSKEWCDRVPGCNAFNVFKFLPNGLHYSCAKSLWRNPVPSPYPYWAHRSTHRISFFSKGENLLWQNQFPTEGEKRSIG